MLEISSDVDESTNVPWTKLRSYIVGKILKVTRRTMKLQQKQLFSLYINWTWKPLLKYGRTDKRRRQEGGGKLVQISGARPSGRGPWALISAYVFFFSITSLFVECKSYPFQTKHKSLSNRHSFRFIVKIFSRPALDGGEGKIFAITWARCQET